MHLAVRLSKLEYVNLFSFTLRLFVDKSINQLINQSIKRRDQVLFVKVKNKRKKLPDGSGSVKEKSIGMNLKIKDNQEDGLGFRH